MATAWKGRHQSDVDKNFARSICCQNKNDAVVINKTHVFTDRSIGLISLFLFFCKINLNVPAKPGGTTAPTWKQQFKIFRKNLLKSNLYR